MVSDKIQLIGFVSNGCGGSATFRGVAVGGSALRQVLSECRGVLFSSYSTRSTEGISIFVSSSVVFISLKQVLPWLTLTRVSPPDTLRERQ